MKRKLVDIAHARSGDKGDRCDLGLFAPDAATYAVLKREVTNLLALKIVLNGALSGGAARSLRSDNLGKCAAAALLRMEIELPPNFVIPTNAGIQNDA
ncbi:MAG: hypothetical protein DPW12_09340 [Rhodocyclaceae bacterium]|nr:hypothetical protein [Rhodocyclaceae bacterium]